MPTTLDPALDPAFHTRPNSAESTHCGRIGRVVSLTVLSGIGLTGAAAVLLVFEPAGNEARWVWPPAILALVVWMVIQSRRHLRSRARLFVFVSRLRDARAVRRRRE